MLVGGALVLVEPLIAVDSYLRLPFATAHERWGALALPGTILLVAGLFRTLNTPLIRLYEGYPWEHSWIGQARVAAQRSLLLGARVRAAGIRAAVYEWEDAGHAKSMGLADNPELRSRLRSNLTTTLHLLEEDFADLPNAVLPTRLGNVIRAFESYPRRRYGISAVVSWPRLLAVIEKDYALAIDEAKLSFDFTLACSFVASILFATCLTAGLFFMLPAQSTASASAWIFELAMLALVAFTAYRLSVGRAAEWGEAVKAAFDLYRRDLLSKLGYDSSSMTPPQERNLWHAISQRALFGDSPRVRDPGWRRCSTFASAEPADISLEITNGLASAETSDGVVVKCRIRNLDTVRVARSVVLTQVLPAGKAYVWGSEELLRGTVRVSGTNPYDFAIGDLQPGQEVVINFTFGEMGIVASGNAAKKSTKDEAHVG